MRRNPILIFWALVMLGALVSASSQRLATRDSNDYISMLKRGVLIKNGKLTSCELIPIDSRAAVVAASCLDFTSGTNLDSDTKYIVRYDSRNDEIEGTYSVNKIKVHPDFNPSNYVNDLAVLQFNPNSKLTWQGRLAIYGGYSWDELVYARAKLNDLDNPSWDYETLSADTFYDDTCSSLSEMFKTNMDDMVCSPNTTYAQSNNLYPCKIPMGIAFGIANEKAFLIGPYSYTAVSGGDDLCLYSYERSYYTAVGSYLGFIKDTIGRDILAGDEKFTDARYDSDYKMVDKDFSNEDGMKSAKLGGDFFKDQTGSSSISLSEDPSSSDLSLISDDSSSNSADDSNDDEGGLSQREKIIIGVCVSVGATIVLGLIMFLCWWIRWRNSDVTDPVAQTMYRDVIEAEIGGATVPALASNSNLVRSESISELAADATAGYQRGSVVNRSNNLDVFHAELPPMYDEAVEMRELSMPVPADKDNPKKGD